MAKKPDGLKTRSNRGQGREQPKTSGGWDVIGYMVAGQPLYGRAERAEHKILVDTTRALLRIKTRRDMLASVRRAYQGRVASTNKMQHVEIPAALQRAFKLAEEARRARELVSARDRILAEKAAAAQRA